MPQNPSVDYRRRGKNAYRTDINQHSIIVPGDEVPFTPTEQEATLLTVPRGDGQLDRVSYWRDRTKIGPAFAWRAYLYVYDPLIDTYIYISLLAPSGQWAWSVYWMNYPMMEGTEMRFRNYAPNYNQPHGYDTHFHFRISSSRNRNEDYVSTLQPTP